MRSGRVHTQTPDRHLPQRAGEPGEQGLARRDHLTLTHQHERERADPCHTDDEGDCESRLYPNPINKQRELAHDHLIDVLPGSMALLYRES
jgi:hypothetical protein